MTADQARRYRLILVTVTLALLAVVLWLGRGSLTPFVIGAILAYLLLPLVRQIEGLMPPEGRLRRFRRTIAVLVVYAVSAIVVITTVNLVIPPLFRQIGEIIDELPQLIEEARARGETWLLLYHNLVPDVIEQAIEANLATAGERLGSAVQTALTSTIGWILRTANVIFGLFVIPLWLFYVLKDEPAGRRAFLDLMPKAARPDIQTVAAIVNSVLSRYIRGQLILGLVIGVASVIAFSLIGLPYALVLGVVNGLFELIPIIGPWLGAIPGVLVTLAVAPDKVGFVILFYILLQQVENSLLVPKIQGDAVEMNPAVLIMALVIAGDAFGIWGLLVAVPLAAIVRNVFAYLYQRFSPERVLVESGAAGEPGTPSAPPPGTPAS